MRQRGDHAMTSTHARVSGGTHRRGGLALSRGASSATLSCAHACGHGQREDTGVPAELHPSTGSTLDVVDVLWSCAFDERARSLHVGESHLMRPHKAHHFPILAPP